MIYVTGDIHGDTYDLFDRFKNISLTNEDIIVLLGDVGLNYSRTIRDTILKEKIQSKIPATLFCIRGNHEIRPSTIETYQIKTFCQGKVYYESDYPNIMFAIDGERYYFESLKRSALVIGGAYSVDKYFRLQEGLAWFSDEQLYEDEKKSILTNIVGNSEVDLVFTHTCPYDWQPTDLFLPQIDQSTVDNSMEHFLTEVESKLTYKHWFFGHFHDDRKMSDKHTMLFRKVVYLE